MFWPFSAKKNQKKPQEKPGMSPHEESKEQQIPSLFLDPITLEIMEDPIKLDPYHQVDRKTLPALKGINPFTRNKIDKLTEGTDLKTAIKRFITSLKEINKLKTALHELEKPIDHLAEELDDPFLENVSPKQLKRLQDEQKAELKKTSHYIEIRANYLNSIRKFIEETEAVINNDTARLLKERNKEIKTVLGEYKKIVSEHRLASFHSEHHATVLGLARPAETLRLFSQKHAVVVRKIDDFISPSAATEQINCLDQRRSL